MLPKSAFVIREGVYSEIACEELVIGDLVHVKAGFCVPADIRVISCNTLKVDNSSITGESEPQTRLPIYTDPNPLETANLAFYGTNVVEGSGYGIIIATGKNTLMGHIAGLTSVLVAEETNIKKELKLFIKLITTMALLVGVSCFIASLMMGYNIIRAFIFCIAIIVANVPEGLMVTLTASLTLTAKRLARKHCLVKNLQAIETLGSTSVICSDKTGTLTQNRMTVSHMYYDLDIVDVLHPTYRAFPTASFKVLCRVGILCSKAEYHVNDMDLPAEERRILGDASEVAVMKAMEVMVGDILDRREKNPKICEIPFNSVNKYQLSIHKRVRGSYLLVMKGAPEKILERCTTVVSNGKGVSIGPYRKTIEKAVLNMGYMGERVLAFADLELDRTRYKDNFIFDVNTINFPVTGLRFAGLMSMIDPPKEGVLDAIQKCRTAGIKVVMLTGDHPITAMAIAKKVGIISPDKSTPYDIAMAKNISITAVPKEEVAACPAVVISGWDLRTMSQRELDKIIQHHTEIVFARTSPQQKLQIVEAFQRHEEIVAVTGDGVNDSPALKKADIGISMGITGSDVSKEAADMVLLDDNFATIVLGIEEGRLIFDNLKKTLGYLLTSNLPEIIPFLLFVIISIPSALSVMAIIIIDVGTDLWPAISLAYEKAESDIMRRQPRNLKKDRLVDLKLILYTYIQVGVVQACAGLSAYFYTMAKHGFLIDRIIGLRVDWDDKSNNAVVDSYGQEWSYEERLILERKGYSAYFLAMVSTQVADVLICKTRRLSLIQQGMDNWVLNLGILFEMGLAALVVYCPYINEMVRLQPINILYILPALPYALFIMVFDELRRYCIRKYSGTSLEREIYY
ncbi:sodium/potassium-transporting atpase subunit alpha [Holotrichia oblita]|uniref:Sodium/potassium-transporting atpase subunit alpha n=1 Tax=Holotrichia oblita TaxID=644536 RepID=A0ACB9SSM4_HOLOL|nr:sodium/potassium-transporting atpase subunit alpha [Holotrichia oblita]